MLAIENNSTAMYFDFKVVDNISRRQLTVETAIYNTKERLTTTKDALNNITYTCLRLGMKRGLKSSAGRLRGFFQLFNPANNCESLVMLETIFGEHIQQKIYRAFEPIEVVVSNDNISRGH